MPRRAVLCLLDCCGCSRENDLPRAPKSACLPTPCSPAPPPTRTPKHCSIARREKDVPIDLLELPNKSERVLQVAWEAHGHKLAVLHGEGSRPSMSIYTMKDTKGTSESPAPCLLRAVVPVGRSARGCGEGRAPVSDLPPACCDVCGRVELC